MDKVKEYYENRVEKEWDRLDRYKMEYYITLKILDKHIRGKNLKICDIGGGPGKYSMFLAKQKHRVMLFDLSEKNIEYAKTLAQKKKIKLDKFVVGNAINLHMFKDESFDVVLLMGPLYHLISEIHRKQAIAEARRILTKNGLIFASFINPLEFVRFIAQHKPKWAKKNSEIIDKVIKYGILEDSVNLNGATYLTRMFFYSPKNFLSFMRNNGFKNVSTYGMETISGRNYDKVNLLKGSAWNWWFDFNWRFCSDQSLLPLSGHLLYVGKKI